MQDVTDVTVLCGFESSALRDAPAARRGYFPQNGFGGFEVSAQYFGDGKIHFRMPFHHAGKNAGWDQGNLTLLQGGHVNFRQDSTHNGTQSAYLSFAGHRQGNCMAPSRYGYFH